MHRDRGSVNPFTILSRAGVTASHVAYMSHPKETAPLIEHAVTEWTVALRWVDTLHTNNGPTPGTVPSYFELDTRLAWHLSTRLELSLAGQNLLHSRHPEYGFPDPARPEIERSAYGKIAYRY